MRLLSAVALLLAAMAATAQAQPKPAQPEKEHEWLKQLEGEWETEAESKMEGFPEVKCTGTMSARMLGGLWLISENETTMPGFEMKAVQTIGYDPAKKKYVGTWVDSMMNHMWQYEGTVDESGKILTLEAEGPHFSEAGKTTMYRDIYEIKSPDHIIATSMVQGPDGKWITMMVGNSKRKAAK